MFHLLRREEVDIYTIYITCYGYIISRTSKCIWLTKCADQSHSFLLKNLSLEMLQLTLAVRRGVGFGRLSAAAMRWHSTPAPSLDLSEGEREIYQKLTDKFSPTTLRVQDISGTLLSRGWPWWWWWWWWWCELDWFFFVGGCGSFYAIAITSEAFRGLSMVKQHQLVNKTLKNEIETIHGLQVGHSISYIPVADFLYSASDDRTWCSCRIDQTALHLAWYPLMGTILNESIPWDPTFHPQ